MTYMFQGVARCFQQKIPRVRDIFFTLLFKYRARSGKKRPHRVIGSRLRHAGFSVKIIIHLLDLRPIAEPAALASPSGRLHAAEILIELCPRCAASDVEDAGMDPSRRSGRDPSVICKEGV